MLEYKIKPYEQLDITDNFMFSKVFSNVDVLVREESQPNITMGDLCYKNFYIFKKHPARIPSQGRTT